MVTETLQAFDWQQLLQHTGALRIEHLALALLGEYSLNGIKKNYAVGTSAWSILWLSLLPTLIPAKAPIPR